MSCTFSLKIQTYILLLYVHNQQECIFYTLCNECNAGASFFYKIYKIEMVPHDVYSFLIVHMSIVKVRSTKKV